MAKLPINPFAVDPPSDAQDRALAAAVKKQRLKLRLDDTLSFAERQYREAENAALTHKTESKLSPEQRRKRDLFVDEYLVDFNATAAVIRTGGSKKGASYKAHLLMQEPYVQLRIRQTIDALEEAKIINRQRILAGLVREAHYSGVGASHSARVAAWSTLARIIGMEAPIKVEASHEVRGGVMVIPMADPASWEASAVTAQKLLKDDVRK